MNKEEIIEMARQAGFERLGHDEHDYVCYPDDIESFAQLVAEHEREACARRLDSVGCPHCAANIRLRGQE